MQRRNFLRWSSLLGFAGLMPTQSLFAQDQLLFNEEMTASKNDREYWVALLDKIASPVLANMSKGELRKNMRLEFSPTWDGRVNAVGYMEAFGRLLAGIAPFLSLKDDGSAESEIRQRLLLQAQQSLAHAVDPASPDYLYWGDGRTAQPLVDAAYIAQALLTSPEVLWYPLSETTRSQFIHEFKTIRQIKPFKNNWVLFAAMIEAFLLSIGEEIDAPRLDNGIDQVIKWYAGDGWYSDGDKFHFDHYNGYVIHPMLVDILKVNVAKGRRDVKEYEIAYKRMQRYASFLERYISPEGTYLVVGRSSTYRVGAFQPLVKLALENNLPKEIEPAQVRCALTAVMKRMFIPSTFTKEGWLTIGLIGNQQQDLADYYSNTGSMYITSLVFLSLGLPADHIFWSGPFTEWTQRKAWSGKPFAKDYAVNY